MCADIMQITVPFLLGIWASVLFGIFMESWNLFRTKGWLCYVCMLNDPQDTSGNVLAAGECCCGVGTNFLRITEITEGVSRKG